MIVRSRADGLVEGAPFFVVLLFGGGYYGAVTALSLDGLRDAVGRRTARARGLSVCSLPFAGQWAGRVPDVTLPDEFRAQLVVLDHPADD